ncbi:MAG: RloB family protein [Bryobacteraceae bacterium]
MLRRRKPFREPKPRVLIVCEGGVTEEQYFNDLCNRERKTILVTESGGDPKTLVEKAASMMKASKRNASKDANERYDHVWCVFDRDEHTRYADALQQARDNGIKVALSNPCFELWALLHFQDQRAWIDRSNVQHLCRQHMPGYVKRLPCDTLYPFVDEAKRRAIELDHWHATRGTTGDNPSTTVYLLVDIIRPPRGV